MNSNARRIIDAALKATTLDAAVRVAKLIEGDIGARHQRPIGDRFNNYGLMASSGSVRAQVARAGDQHAGRHDRATRGGAVRRPLKGAVRHA